MLKLISLILLISLNSLVIDIKASKTFIKNEKALTRYVFNQGGTRSGKTYGLMQLAFFTAKKNNGSIVSVVSETMPHLKRGAMRDFFHFLQFNNLYQPSCHNKTDNAYKVGNSLIEFFSCDSPDKVHGPGRDYLFVNEIQNIQYETFFHLAQRTNKRIYADYNPTHEFWVYPEFLENPQYEGDVTYIHSTILDNPFVSDAIKKDVLLRAERDANYKKVYLEGEKGSLEGLIYPKYTLIDSMPVCELSAYGLDFGFTHPTAFIHCGIKDNNLYIDELLYSEGLTGAGLAAEIAKLNIKKGFDEIFADQARPEIIEEIYRAGYNIKGATKGDGSVNYGIDLIKRFDNIFITKRSINTIKEIRNYRWQTDKNGKATDKPVKILDDAMDAIRYMVVMNADINKIQTFGVSIY